MPSVMTAALKGGEPARGGRLLVVGQSIQPRPAAPAGAPARRERESGLPPEAVASLCVNSHCERLRFITRTKQRPSWFAHA